jgi:hypothetical protein
MSNLQKIYIVIQNMDISFLEANLDDAIKYQNVSKATFLRKLQEEIFQIFKYENEARLIPYAGKCGSCDCPYKGNKGFTFVGSQSKLKVNFIFEGENEVSDIYYCGKFVPDNAEIQDIWNLELRFEPFEESNTDLLNETDGIINSCKSAYEELINYGFNGINKQIFRNWFGKYHDLHKLVNNKKTLNSEVEKFNNVIQWLYEVFSNSNLNQDAKNAIDAYKLIDHSDEIQVLKWIVFHEDLIVKTRMYSSISRVGKKLFTKIGDEETKTIYYYSNLNYYINPLEFRDIAEFDDAFYTHYHPLIKKYQDPKTDFENEITQDEHGEPTYSNNLSFWVKRKGIDLG